MNLRDKVAAAVKAEIDKRALHWQCDPYWFADAIMPILLSEMDKAAGKAADVISEDAQRMLAKQRDQIVIAVERAMNVERAGGCACPPSSQRSCGWRAGMGRAAEVAREFRLEVES